MSSAMEGIEDIILFDHNIGFKDETKMKAMSILQILNQTAFSYFDFLSSLCILNNIY